ncbi:DNA topoisomerase IV subunit B [Candidatus Malacoplasma girerdii]|uniref:DNA topoisomerase (ATP-hydrolyzing) n=1 Tax=Candidatus Malacoplasma girerdii TaxID=1318617 RepID=A0A097SSV0_9BACT|nr:DNA topoisomerase IV subunit B [Candidatus Malacoplasma girerdii]
MSQQYKDSDIKVLSGLEPVRKRPGMYIGSTDSYGLHHLVWEIFDNAIDEVIAGNCNLIKLTIHKDQSISVEDNGRGIPLGKNSQTGLSTIDTVFTVLHAGGKFDDSAYKTSGGLHGVGASVVNALSSWLEVSVKRDNKIFTARYENGGNIVSPAHEIGKTNRTGTYVRFLPDTSIFKTTKFNPNLIKERIRESSYLYQGLTIEFNDLNTNETQTFISQKGLIEYAEFINESRNPIFPAIGFKGKSDDIEVDIALQYTNETNEIIISFANSVKTNEGGSHETGFKTSLTEVINNYARKNNLLKDKDKNFDGDDVREGITAVVSVRVPEKIIAYEGQTKNKLFTIQANTAVKKVFADQFTYWLEEHAKDAKNIVNKALASRDARIAAKKAREDIKKLRNTNKQTTILSGKLTPAQSKNYANNELFIVEGDSAGGSAKLARDKKYQAILPLRGKVLNVEKASIRDLLKNEEICTLISCIGTGINPEFDLKSLRYGKVIIMTDADVDGAHIQILLLTFFYRFMKPLIENGHVYVALSPLYKLTDKTSKQVTYAWDNNELNIAKEKLKNYEIQRYKGLGEMNADQLWETTMNPNNRKLVKVTITDAALAEKQVATLMGDNVENRKRWISENIDFTTENL